MFRTARMEETNALKRHMKVNKEASDKLSKLYTTNLNKKNHIKTSICLQGFFWSAADS